MFNVKQDISVMFSQFRFNDVSKNRRKERTANIVEMISNRIHKQTKKDESKNCLISPQ